MTDNDRFCAIARHIEMTHCPECGQLLTLDDHFIWGSGWDPNGVDHCIITIGDDCGEYTYRGCEVIESNDEALTVLEAHLFREMSQQEDTP